jgi:GT2 family glycosyltransferase
VNLDPGFVSGACLCIERDLYRELGGMPAPFFLYHEDVDLSLRLRLAGGTLGIEPAAVVAHDYEFTASPGRKWRWLERNRLAFLVRVYPTPLLVLLAPALLATELALLFVSAAGGWGGQKLAANLEALRWLPRLLRERRQIQRHATINSADFASWLTPDLDSPFIAPAARTRPVRWSLRAYLSAVRMVLGRSSR